MYRRVAALFGAAVIMSTASCGVVKLVEPQAQGNTTTTAPVATVWLDSCALFTAAEIEAAAGLKIPHEPMRDFALAADNAYGNYCEWSDGRTAMVVAWIDGNSHGPEEQENGGDGEAIGGLGRSAEIKRDEGPNSVSVVAHTTNGVGFTITIARPGVPDAKRHEALMHLARLAADRITSQQPGSRETFPPRPGDAPTNPCTLVTPQQRNEILGYASDRDRRPFVNTPEPFTGGPDGGGWMCYFADTQFQARTEVRISAGPVAAAALAAGGDPLGKVFRRPAFYRPSPPDEQALGLYYARSRLRVSLADGRALTLELRDPKADDVSRRDRLTRLADAILAGLGQ